MIKTPHNTSTLLNWARHREGTADLIGAGVCLRAAIFRHLYSLAKQKRCLPRLKDHRNSPKWLAAALLAAKAIEDSDHAFIRETLVACNVAAHVGDVDRTAIRDGMKWLGRLIGNCPHADAQALQGRLAKLAIGGEA